MQRFAAGENVRVAPLRRQPVNELVAVSTEFAAATEQGVLRGLVSFVSHGDQTYRLLGLAPDGRWFARQAAVSRSLGSFAALTDPAILSVQPARLEIVQTPAEMTLAAFLEQFPATVEPETVALINHVEGDGSFSGDILYKLVVGGR